MKGANFIHIEGLEVGKFGVCSRVLNSKMLFEPLLNRNVLVIREY